MENCGVFGVKVVCVYSNHWVLKHYLLNCTNIGLISVLVLNVTKGSRGHSHTFHFQYPFARKCDFWCNVKNDNIIRCMLDG